MQESKFTKGVMTMADGTKRDVITEQRPNKNGGVDVIVHAPAFNIGTKQVTKGEQDGKRNI